MSKWSSSLTTAVPSPCPPKPADQRDKNSSKCAGGSLLSPHCKSGASPGQSSAKGAKASKAPAGTVIELNLAALSRQSHRPLHHKSLMPKTTKPHENSKVSEKLRVAIQAREVAKLQIGSPKRRQARTEQRAETYATIDERQESGERLASEEETKEGVRLGDTKRGTVTFVHPPGSIRLGPGAATPQEKASDMNTDSSERVNAVYRTGRCNGLRDHRGKCQCPKDPSLPCCVRAAKWIKLMFDNKGTKFDHAKYREQYEVGKRSEEPGRTS